MNFSDGFRLRGDLSIVVRRAADRRVLERILIRNTITFNGLHGALRLLKQDENAPTDYQIASIRAGSGTTPPTREDLGLESPVFTVPLDATTRQLVLSSS